jgi:hypothetical protein
MLLVGRSTCHVTGVVHQGSRYFFCNPWDEETLFAFHPAFPRPFLELLPQLLEFSHIPALQTLFSFFCRSRTLKLHTPFSPPMTASLSRRFLVHPLCRVILRTDRQPLPLTRRLIRHLHDIHKLLLLRNREVDLVVISRAEVDLYVFVAICGSALSSLSSLLPFISFIHSTRRH